MPKHYISYPKTGYFSSLIEDYLEENKVIQPFYYRFPHLENFAGQMDEKAASYPSGHRKILRGELLKQYSGMQVSPATTAHLQNLGDDNTFTITTGHQLNLFTGPLYFLYKIISTINLCKQLKAQYPDNNFVPVYWMATEDHDFVEINHFNFQNKKVAWERKSGGAVGELDTEGLDKVLEIFSGNLNNTTNAGKLKELFRKVYLEHKDLAGATRYLANDLFGEQGLVIIDGNSRELKNLFVPFIKQELMEQVSAEAIDNTNNKLASLQHKNYKIQVNPREINLFYLTVGIRERIIKRDGRFYVNNTPLSFSSEEMIDEVTQYPERFSPNVMLRPLYEEVILPNLCYIGGGGELAYWMQLKEYFKVVNIPFPMLLLRNSVLLVPEKLIGKIDKLDLSIEDLFLPQEELETKMTRQVSEIEIDFSPQRKHLKKQFQDLYELAEKTDSSFTGAVAAQEKKQIKGLDNLEKRLLKAQKRKLADHLNRVTAIQNELFPNGNLQERTHNFSEWYLEYGEELIPKLMNELDPLDGRFLVLEM